MISIPLPEVVHLDSYKVVFNDDETITVKLKAIVSDIVALPHNPMSLDPPEFVDCLCSGQYTLYEYTQADIPKSEDDVLEYLKENPLDYCHWFPVDQSDDWHTDY